MRNAFRSAAWMTLYFAVMVINGLIILASFICFGLYAIPLAVLSFFITLAFCFALIEKT